MRTAGDLKHSISLSLPQSAVSQGLRRIGIQDHKTARRLLNLIIDNKVTRIIKKKRREVEKKDKVVEDTATPRKPARASKGLDRVQSAHCIAYDPST